VCGARWKRPSSEVPCPAVAGKAITAGAGRVLERRRAVALAQHYREFEGVSIREIADRLGRSPATVKAYFYDPTGEKARAVKARYVGVCRGCGAYTQPRNGKGDPTRTARPATPAPSGESGHASASCTRCVSGGLATGGCPPRMIGRAPTRAGAAARRSSGWPKRNGRRRASSPSCSERGPLSVPWRRGPPTPQMRRHESRSVGEIDGRDRRLRRCCGRADTRRTSLSTEPSERSHDRKGRGWENERLRPDEGVPIDRPVCVVLRAQPGRSPVRREPA
jgi:hypothetical protein